MHPLGLKKGPLRGRTKPLAGELRPRPVVATPKSPTLKLATPLFAVSLLALCACVQSAKKSDGLNQVDDLLSRIEKVYVECELADARVREAVETLSWLTSEDFDGDPLEVHAAMALAAERADLQAKELERSIAPMKASGEALFQRWTNDLESFRSASMRARSAERLAQTRARYDAIVASVEPAFERMQELNVLLGDSVLFLANDLNAGAIADLRGDIEAMLASAKELSGQLDVCLSAADGYMRSAALPEGLGEDAASAEKSGA